MNDFAARLAALDNDFENTAAIGGALPEGRYIGEIKVCRVEETKKEGDDTLYLNIHAHTPEGVGFPSVRLTNHPSEKSMGFAKGQLSNLGHTGTLSSVLAAAESGLWIGRHVEFDVTKTQEGDKEYTNYAIRKIVTPAHNANQGNFFDAAPTQQAANADIPFDATGAPVQAQAPVAQAPAPAFDQAVQQQQAPAAPTNLPFA